MKNETLLEEMDVTPAVSRNLENILLRWYSRTE
jgi:hypothetical protein